MTITFHLEDIAEAADNFWLAAGPQRVIAFHGAMGAGKTTFIHALCKAKQVTSPVSSPTFSIINEYAYPGGVLYHIDLYRLQQEEEAFSAGVEDCLYSGNICLVEWAEKAPSLFPPATMHASIEVIDPVTRRLVIDPS
ncbi:MAG TPA: tRNA (adenosine(37)-N6)-threonylcarbamoyltransferase complex ATPase subunit type 1 TsaE [Chitinophagaceae bacterium]|nr:tRNA (adenosine(37)-N6)-threonylcarbamoyltransferase complex ATPase subunit type 1 TsaE [Chitinophagaceae bacterium]